MFSWCLGGFRRVLRFLCITAHPDTILISRGSDSTYFLGREEEDQTLFKIQKTTHWSIRVFLK